MDGSIEVGELSRGATGRRAAGAGPVAPARALIALLAVAMLGAGCMQETGSTDDAREELTSEEFVAIVTALREAERDVAQEDSAAALFAERKAEILARHERSEAELRAFLVNHGEDVPALQEVWDTIAQRLKYAPGEIGEPEEPGEPAAPGEPGERAAPEAAPAKDVLPPSARRVPGERRLH